MNHGACALRAHTSSFTAVSALESVTEMTCNVIAPKALTRAGRTARWPRTASLPSTTQARKLHGGSHSHQRPSSTRHKGRTQRPPSTRLRRAGRVGPTGVPCGEQRQRAAAAIAPRATHPPRVRGLDEDNRECLQRNPGQRSSGEIPGALSAGISFGKACLRRAKFGHRNARPCARDRRCFLSSYVSHDM